MKYNLLVIFLVTIYSCSISKIKKEVKKTSIDLTSYNSENFDFSENFDKKRIVPPNEYEVLNRVRPSSADCPSSVNVHFKGSTSLDFLLN